MSSEFNTRLDKYIKAFRKLRVAKSPHKVCLLLGVIDLVERNSLSENKIYYEPPLIENFKRYLGKTRPESEASFETAFYPMLHLANNQFWLLHHKPGKEDELAKFYKGQAKRSNKFVRENVAYASLDSDLYELLHDANARAELRKTLASAWPEDHAIHNAPKETEYEIKLIEATLQGILCAQKDLPPKVVRRPVFRRLVLHAYGYKCAATRLRFDLPDETSLLEAAHIHPFSCSYDDRTVNGMALTPNIHRAMDRHLIAPGPDRKWHVSKYTGEETRENVTLRELDGREMLPTVEEINRPDKDALECRYEEFREMEQKRK